MKPLRSPAFHRAAEARIIAQISRSATRGSRTGSAAPAPVAGPTCAAPAYWPMTSRPAAALSAVPQPRAVDDDDGNDDVVASVPEEREWLAQASAPSAASSATGAA